MENDFCLVWILTLFLFFATNVCAKRTRNDPIGFYVLAIEKCKYHTNTT